jgi:hypothetical protein
MVKMKNKILQWFGGYCFVTFFLFLMIVSSAFLSGVNPIKEHGWNGCIYVFLILVSGHLHRRLEIWVYK